MEIKAHVFGFMRSASLQQHYWLVFKEGLNASVLVYEQYISCINKNKNFKQKQKGVTKTLVCDTLVNDL